MSLTTDMRASALLRFCQTQMIGAYVICKGDPDAGALIIKQAHLDGTARIFTRQFGQSGQMEWVCVSGDDAMAETDADIYLQRRKQNDPDLWIIEIEKSGEPLPLDDF